VLSVVRTSAERRRPQRPEFADTTVWGVASFVSRLSIGCAKVAATSLRRCTRGGVIVINSPLNLALAVRFVVGAGAWDGVWQHSVLHVPVAPVQVPPLTSTIP